jgi:hypothetical protein
VHALAHGSSLDAEHLRDIGCRHLLRNSADADRCAYGAVFRLRRGLAASRPT